MRVSRALLLSLAFWLSAPAVAGLVEDELGEALVAIKDGEFDEARRLLDTAEARVVDSPTVITGTTLASVHFYRGVLEYYDGDRDKATLEHWRRALVADQTFAFDTSLVADREPQDLFEALRMEIRSRPHSESGVVEGTDVRVFVDGRMLQEYDMVVSGRHFVQVLCADEQLINSWHEFGEAPDYYADCGQPTSTVAAVEPEAPEAPKEPRAPRDLNVARVAAWGAGGALFAGGVITNFALVEPAWDDVTAARAAPATLTRAEADALTSKFNLYRTTTLGLMTLGVAGITTGFFLDEGPQVFITPGGAGLSGRF